MSLLAHLREYYDNYMECTDEINLMFLRRPPVTFTVYPEEYEVTGRPLIFSSPASRINTRIPESDERMLLVPYYREKLGYEIKNPDDFVVFFDHDNTTAYPLEVLYVSDLESYVATLASQLTTPPNPFTIVV